MAHSSLIVGLPPAHSCPQAFVMNVMSDVGRRVSARPTQLSTATPGSNISRVLLNKQSLSRLRSSCSSVSCPRPSLHSRPPNLGGFARQSQRSAETLWINRHLGPAPLILLSTTRRIKQLNASPHASELAHYLAVGLQSAASRIPRQV